MQLVGFWEDKIITFFHLLSLLFTGKTPSGVKVPADGLSKAFSFYMMSQYCNADKIALGLFFQLHWECRVWEPDIDCVLPQEDKL